MKQRSHTNISVTYCSLSVKQKYSFFQVHVMRIIAAIIQVIQVIPKDTPFRKKTNNKKKTDWSTPEWSAEFKQHQKSDRKLTHYTPWKAQTNPATVPF